MRLRALIRRAAGYADTVVRCGPISFNTHIGVFEIDGLPLRLTALEWRVLSCLALRKGLVVARSELFEHVYAGEGESDSNSVEVIIVTIYRRFGKAAALPEPNSNERARMEDASASAKAEDVRKAADAVAFGTWMQDPSIPEPVKAFTLRTARMIALTERCPNSASILNTLDADALKVGVNPTDLLPDGRYASLMADMLEQMRAGTAKETVQSACEAAARYR